MNQSAAHRRLAGNRLKNPRPSDLKPLFEKRLAANFTLLDQLFHALYPGRENDFAALLERLSALYETRPATCSCRI